MHSVLITVMRMLFRVSNKKQPQSTFQVNIWKIIYFNYRYVKRYEDMINHRSYSHNLSSCEIKAWTKKIMAKRDSNPVCIAACIVYITAMINQQLIYFSAVEIYNLSYIYLHYHHLLQVYYELTMLPAPSWLDSSVGRVLHR